jgi:hypothetical protein
VHQRFRHTVGYTRELGTAAKIDCVGFNLTAYNIASDLKAFYGNRPVAASASSDSVLMTEPNS